MNHSLSRRVAWISLATLAAAATSCTPSSQSGPAAGLPSASQLPTAPVSAIEAAVASASATAPAAPLPLPSGAPAKTFAAIRDLLNKQANFAVSTYSLERCLGLLALGAKGKTLQELQAYLRTDNLAG